MKNSYLPAEILENEEIYKDIYLMKLICPISGLPGQFVMVRQEGESYDPLLSRPLGIVDLVGDELTLLYQIVGRGTRSLAKKKKGDQLQILGGLGNGFEIKKASKVAVVAGGIGIAPLLYLVKNLDSKPDFYAGFAEDPYFIEPFKEYCNNIVLTSDRDDGIFITEKIDPACYDLIYACGPNPMLKNLCKKNIDTEIQISMESRMACGIGACLGCTVDTKFAKKRVCKDGPVFDGREVF